MFIGIGLGLTRIGGASFSPASLYGSTAGILYDYTSAANLLWRYNLLTWTEQFDNAAWPKTNVTLTSNAATAPDGTVTADGFAASTNALAYFYRSAAFTNGQWTYSLYVKQMGANSSFDFYFNDPSGRAAVTLTFASGALSLSAASVTGTVFSNASVVSNDLGSGWYRVALTASYANGTTPAIALMQLTGRDGTSGAYIWGAQLELSSTATTYQKITDPDMDAVFYCPQNPLYQDTTGSMAVTTPDETVGLALDTSRELALGPELVTNGDFSAGTTGWTDILGSWAVTGGELVGTGIAANAYGPYSNGTAVVAGKFYVATFSVSVSSGSLAVRVGNDQSSAYSTSGIARRIFQAVTSGVTVFQLRAGGSGFTGSIDNISVREINSVPLLQANAGLRPKWGIAPASRRNLLTYTEQFDNAAWQKGASGTATAPVVTPNVALAPNGEMTADLVQLRLNGAVDGSFSWLYQNVTVPSGVTRAASFFVRAANPADIGKVIRLTGATNTSVSLTADWQRISNSALVAVGAVFSVGIRLRGFESTADSVDLHLWAGQFEDGSTATTYQAVTNQFNMTQAGFPSYGYSRYDLVDDVMSATIPTAQTGDTLVFGRNGSWIESGVTYGAGSTFSIGAATVTGTVTGLPYRSLTAIGDVVGVLAIGRTLTAEERQNALSYYMARGAAGWLVAGAEMLTNGNFATDLTGWTNENITRGTSTWVAGQAFLDNTGTGNTVLWQSVTTVIGQPYLVSWDAAAVTAPATARCFAGTSSTNGSNFSIISPTPPSSNRAIFVATATTTFISVSAFGATGNATFDNVSLKPLVIA